MILYAAKKISWNTYYVLLISIVQIYISNVVYFLSLDLGKFSPDNMESLCAIQSLVWTIYNDFTKVITIDGVH